MKLFLSILFVAMIGVVAQAQPPKLPVTPGSVYGDAATTANGAVPVSELPKILDGADSKAVKVTAKVVDVCPKKGCWMALEMPDQTKVFVKMKDYGFFVPIELIGKTVVVDAEAKTITTSVKELQHYAEDAKKSKEEIAAITEPKQEIRLMANGIVVTK